MEGWSFPGHSLTLSQGLEEQSPKGVEVRWSRPVGSGERGVRWGAALAGTGLSGCSPDDLRGINCVVTATDLEIQTEGSMPHSQCISHLSFI